jgi:hypothetical protein
MTETEKLKAALALIRKIAADNKRDQSTAAKTIYRTALCAIIAQVDRTLGKA